jgi:hypothetical protein
MPRPACLASRWILSNLPLEYCGQSGARPLLTSHSARSAPATEHEATVRPYWSKEIGKQLTGRLATKPSRSLAAFAPHRYCKLQSSGGHPAASVAALGPGTGLPALMMLTRMQMDLKDPDPQVAIRSYFLERNGKRNAVRSALFQEQIQIIATAIGKPAVTAPTITRVKAKSGFASGPTLSTDMSLAPSRGSIEKPPPGQVR